MDGEVVITNEHGLTDFGLLQNHVKNAANIAPAYIVFDILALDGQDLRDHQLLQRRQVLKQVMKKNKSANLVLSRQIKGKGNKIFEAACKLGAEGIIAKKKQSKYNGSRNQDWLKIKCGHMQEFVIGGFAVSHKQTNGISSLLLGYYQNENLVFAGKVGTGFTASMRKQLKKALSELLQQTSAFTQPQKPNKNEQFFFTKPVLIAQVAFAGWTNSNLVRQASFKGLRSDKSPNQVVKETKKTKQSEKQSPVQNQVKITSPEKLLFKNPDITKQQIVDYYLAVSKRMLPYIVDRVISIKKCPKGIHEECFFERNYKLKKQGVEPVKVKGNKGKNSTYFCVKDLQGLISQVQFNTIEFHPWGSTVKNLEQPDIMVFDLDPDQGMSLQDVRQGVRHLKSVLDKLSLKSFLKTSGGKGYHVVVPFSSTLNWQHFYQFSKQVAELMQQTWPDKYTTNIRKASRKNKIFIDFARNRRSATSVAPYSVRIRKGATVSMPIKWSELDKVAPDQITIFEAMERVKKADPWKNFFNTQQKLT